MQIRISSQLLALTTPVAPCYRGEMPSNAPPIHFFTIVLNGQPFIEYHLDLFKQLPLRWHWHIVEGLADLVYDTSWSLERGGRLAPEIHRSGLSIDGTSEYIDAVATQFSTSVTVYRKPNGDLWRGKREMIAAPLRTILEPCLLWQIDADELWMPQQIVAMHQLFSDQVHRTAAFYWCDYFVGPKAVISTRYNYAQSPSKEWLRTWRYSPGCDWVSHEPPVLIARKSPGRYFDLAKRDPFTADETEAAGAKFQHFAYATENQVKFKEIYYGYKGLSENWHSLQRDVTRSVFLYKYFPWVNDLSMADSTDRAVVFPYGERTDDRGWRFLSPKELDYRRATQKLSQPNILLDTTFTDYADPEVSKAWEFFFSEALAAGLANDFIMLDREGTTLRREGFRYRSIPNHHAGSREDAAVLQRLCDEIGVILFVSSRYTMPTATPTVLIHGFLKERFSLHGIVGLTPAENAIIPLAKAHIVFTGQAGIDLMKCCPTVKTEQILNVRDGNSCNLLALVSDQIVLSSFLRRLIRLLTKASLYVP